MNRRDFTKNIAKYGLASAIAMVVGIKTVDEARAGYWQRVYAACKKWNWCEPTGDIWSYDRWYSCTPTGCYPTNTYAWHPNWCGC